MKSRFRPLDKAVRNRFQPQREPGLLPLRQGCNRLAAGLLGLLTPLGDKLMFVAEDGVNGFELRSSDSTEFGTQLAGDGVTLGGVALPIVSWADELIVATLVEGVDDGDIVVVKKLPSDPYAYNIIPQAPDPPIGGQI